MFALTHTHTLPCLSARARVSHCSLNELISHQLINRRYFRKSNIEIISREFRTHRPFEKCIFDTKMWKILPAATRLLEGRSSLPPERKIEKSSYLFLLPRPQIYYREGPKVGEDHLPMITRDFVPIGIGISLVRSLIHVGAGIVGMSENDRRDGRKS